MFCPQCGEQKAVSETTFCSKCGYLLTGTAELIAARGSVSVRGGKAASPRSRGVKQGLFIFMLGFLIVPLLAMLSIWLHTGPFFVLASALSLFVGGILRMIYAAFFETSVSGMPTLEEKLFSGRNLPQHRPAASLDSKPIDYATTGAGRWQETDDLTPIAESRTRPLSSGELR